MTLQDYVALDPTSPSGLVWKQKPSRRVRVGANALAATDVNGYHRGQFAGKNYYAHRVVYFLTHGNWPDVVDHTDGARMNNVPTNLRGATATSNQHNRVARGYYFRKTDSLYVAQIRVRKVLLHVGTYATAEEAHRAYLAAKRIHHPTAPARCYGEPCDLT